MMIPLHGPALLAAARRHLSLEVNDWISGPIDSEPHPNVSSKERDAVYMTIGEKCFLTGLVPSTQITDKIAKKADVEKSSAHEFWWTSSMSATDQKMLQEMCCIFPENHGRYQLYVLSYKRDDMVYYTLVVGKGKRPHFGYVVNYWGGDSSPKFEDLVRGTVDKAAPPDIYVVPEDIHHAEMKRWSKAMWIRLAAFNIWFLVTAIAHYLRIDMLFWLMMSVIGIAAMFVIGYSRPSPIHRRK